MRIMALDLGEKYIGVAISDPLGLTSAGLLKIDRKSIKKDLYEIHRLVEEYAAERVVLGLPLNMNGTRGPAAEHAEAFARRLKGRLRVPVTMWDERLSTVTAEKVLIEGDVRRKERREVIDKMAAVVILQSYLDFLKSTHNKSQ